MVVTMTNEAGVIRQVKIGYSWTSFFFGGMPFCFRGLPLFGAAWMILSIFTCGISNIFLAFLINKQTALYYLENGYKPVGEGWREAGMKWGIRVPLATTSEQSAN